MISEAVQIALISSLTTVVPSAVAAFFSYRASIHARRAADVSLVTERNTNSMKDELVSLTAESSHAKGLLEGKAFRIARGADPLGVDHGVD